MAKVRSSAFQLVIAPMECFKCHAQTLVGAIVAPVGAEAWDDEDEESQWRPVDEMMPLDQVREVSANLAAVLPPLLVTLYLDHSHTADTEYWINHCSSCGVPIGDGHTQSEPDGPFFAWPHAGKIGKLKALGDGQVTCSMPYF